MSTTIDNKVVEMRFDNKQFESGVKTTMSTIEKLKSKLNFHGATKGLENIGEAAKKVNMSGLSNAVETVHAKFSALEIMGITALTNITNSALNAGKRIVSALTIDPVKTGLQEYETQINAIQTILANTQSKGTTLDQVNSALDELNAYADKTIYNFTEMTRNIGTFTAAGVDLETSVKSIQGIANLAAISGSTSQQASTAMYQLSQALSSGTVKLMDWNSVVNAGMGGQVFQDALKETARIHGIAIDDMIEANGSFRETLQEGWLSSEILTETLEKFTLTTEGLTAAQIEQNRAMLRGKGYTDDQIDAIFKLGETATNAATKVKTFSQLTDTLKEAVQSGWTQTWEIIIGDFEQAKELWTSVSDTFGGFINATAEARNSMLEGAMSTNWEKLIKKIEEAGVKTSTFEERLKKVAKKHGIEIDSLITEYGSLEKVFRSGAVSSDVLKEAVDGLSGSLVDLESITRNLNKGKTGEDVKKLQEALNGLGYDLGHWGVDGIIGNYTEKAIKDFQEAHGLVVDGIVGPKTLAALKEATASTDKLIDSYDDLINSITELGGRELLIESFKNVFEGLLSVVKPIGKAFREIFPPMTSEKLYNILKGFRDLTAGMKLSDDSAEKLKRTFKGLFAIIKIITTITGGAFKIALKVLGMLLGAVDLDILSVTASIGDVIVKFQEWITTNNIFTKGIILVVKIIKTTFRLVKEWVKAFLSLPIVQKVINKFKDTVGKAFVKIGNKLAGGINRIKEFIKRVRSMDSISFSDLKHIFKDFKDNVIDYFIDIDGITNTVKKTFGKFRDVVSDRLGDVGKGFIKLKDIIIKVLKTIKNKISNIDLGDILTISMGVGAFLLIKQLFSIGKMLDSISAPFEGFGDVLDGFRGVLSSFSLSIKANAILTIAEAIAVLAASVAVLTLLDQGKVWSAVGVITVLTVVLGGLSVALNKFGSSNSISLPLLTFAGSIVLLVMALKAIDNIDSDNMLKSIGVLGALMAAMVVAIKILGTSKEKTIAKGALSLIAFTISLKILVSALKDVSKLKVDNMESSITVLIGAMLALALLTKSAKGVKFGGTFTILALCVALKVFVGMIDDIASMDYVKLYSQMDNITTLFGMFAIVMASTRLAGKNAAKAGVAVLLMSVSLIIILEAIEKLGKMDKLKTAQAMDTISEILLVFAAVTAVSVFAGKNAIKAGVMILLMTGALLALTLVIGILSKMDPYGVYNAVDAISEITLCFSMLIAASGLAKKCNGTLVLIVGIMAALTASVYLLAGLNQNDIDKATDAFSSVIGMFAILTVASSTLKQASKAKGTLITLTGVVTVLAGIIYLLSDLPVSSVLGTATALSELILALAAACLIISKTEKNAAKAVIAVGLLSAVMLALGGILYLFQDLPVASTIANATALSELMLAMSACLAITSKIPMSGALTAIADIGIFVAGLTAILAVLGGIAQIPGFTWLINEGTEVLGMLGNAIGSFMGNIVGGFMGGVSSSFPQIGSDLSAFMNNAEPFFEGASKIDPASMDGIKALASAILTLTAANVLEGLTSWFAGERSLADFGKELNDFAPTLVEYSEKIANLDAEVVKNSANAALALANFADKIPNQGGLLGKLMGENSITKFGEELVTFGPNLMKYAESVDGLKADVVENSANAALAVATFADKIPNQGGLLADLMGDNTLSTFGEELVAFGPNLMKYAESVAGLDAGVVENSTNAGLALAAFADKIPNQGGVLADLMGDNTLSTFGEELAAFGPKLMEYAKSVDGLNVDVVEKSASAGKALTALADTVPNSGGILGGILGNNDLGPFGENVATFGESLKAYNDSVKDIKLDIVEKSVAAGTALSELAHSLPNSGGIASWFTGDNDIGTFGKHLKTFGQKFYEFYQEIVYVNPELMGKVVDSSRFLVDILKGTKDIDKNSLALFVAALESLSAGSVKKFIEGFENAEEDVTTAAKGFLDDFISGLNAKKDEVCRSLSTTVDNAVISLNTNNVSFYATAMNMIARFIDGFNSKEDDAKNTLAVIADSMTNTVRTKYDDFKAAGSYLVDGFKNGISENAYKVVYQAKLMATNAVQGMEDVLDINSPSRVAYQIGDFTGLGFVNALKDYKTKSYEAASEMGKSAKTGLNDSVSKILDIINGDINTQPTIRPVLDLSNVEKGTSKLNALLSRKQAITISTSMRERANSNNEIQNDTKIPSKGNSYQFVQNNYSPKALSHIEIYRQTRNQFAAMKEVLS